MAKDIFYGNRMPAPIRPFSTGDAKADEALRKLQTMEVYTHGRLALPTDAAFVAARKGAEKVPPEKLLPLLDEAAVDLGASQWSDEHKAKLSTADKKAFQKHYDEVLKAVATRRTYLLWLVGAVCDTPAGLDRALEILRTGPSAAREVTVAALSSRLTSDAAKRRVVDAVDLVPTKQPEDSRYYRTIVAMLNAMDPEAALAKYGKLLDPAAVKAKGGAAIADSVIYGLMASPPAPGWIPRLIPHLRGPLSNPVFLLLGKLPPDERLVEPLCACLPKPKDTKGYWNQHAVKALARSANKAAVPWLTGALWASWMNFPHVFEGFRRAKDPAAVNVMKEWLAKNDAPDRRKLAKPILAELEALGPVPAPAPRTDDAAKPPPKPKRPTLVFKKAKAFKAPKLEPVAKVEKTLRKRFADAGLAKHYDALAQRAVSLVPTRVEEKKIALGATKLGGHPDLEAGAKWPRVRGEPLTFLAQLDLADFAKSLPKGALPAKGLLSFFMGNVGDSERAGYCENAVVLLTKPGAKLVRHEVPEDFFDVIYQACTVKLHETVSLPAANHPLVTKTLKGAALEKYEEDVFDAATPLPRVFGYRDHGWDAEAKRTEQMLLQLPGDDQSDMEFGDADVLAFYVDAKKLAAGDVKKVTPKLGD